MQSLPMIRSAQRNRVWTDRVKGVVQIIEHVLPDSMEKMLMLIIAEYGTNFCSTRLSMVVSGCGVDDYKIEVVYHFPISKVMIEDQLQNQYGVPFEYSLNETGEREPIPDEMKWVSDLWNGADDKVVKLFRRLRR